MYIIQDWNESKQAVERWSNNVCYVIGERTSKSTLACCSIIVMGFLLGVDQETIAGWPFMSFYPKTEQFRPKKPKFWQILTKNQYFDLSYLRNWKKLTKKKKNESHIFDKFRILNKILTFLKPINWQILTKNQYLHLFYLRNWKVLTKKTENPNFDDFVTYKLTNFDQKSIFWSFFLRNWKILTKKARKSNFWSI